MPVPHPARRGLAALSLLALAPVAGACTPAGPDTAAVEAARGAARILEESGQFGESDIRTHMFTAVGVEEVRVDSFTTVLRPGADLAAAGAALSRAAAEHGSTPRIGVGGTWVTGSSVPDAPASSPEAWTGVLERAEDSAATELNVVTADQGDGRTRLVYSLQPAEALPAPPGADPATGAQRPSLTQAQGLARRWADRGAPEGIDVVAAVIILQGAAGLSAEAELDLEGDLEPGPGGLLPDGMEDVVAALRPLAEHGEITRVALDASQQAQGRDGRPDLAVDLDGPGFNPGPGPRYEERTGPSAPPRSSEERASAEAEATEAVARVERILGAPVDAEVRLGSETVLQTGSAASDR